MELIEMEVFTFRNQVITNLEHFIAKVKMTINKLEKSWFNSSNDLLVTNYKTDECTSCSGVHNFKQHLTLEL